MNFPNRILALLMALLLLASACTLAPSSQPTTTPAVEPDLYLQIIWHQHQPFYPTDPETGLVSAPWVRLHAAKDYVDMVTLLEDYPGIHVTFNLTPSLLRQIEDFNAGTRDLAWEMSVLPADQLSESQKTYLLERFFDVNPNILGRYPRYMELQQMRAGADAGSIAAALASWSTQDFLDLQTLFNLAWIDPDYQTQEPLLGLVNQGRDFSEEDKLAVLSIHEELVSQVIPVHRQYQDAGQIEVTFTPYAHPILPLLIDTSLASIAVPDIRLPERYTHGDDAIQQLERGMALYEQQFGRPARGMWPAEGAVAQYMVGMVSRAGVEWMVTDEGILANSLNLDFSRDPGGVPANVTALYRPYTVVKNDQPVTIFFRDTSLSNKVSFDYSQISTQAAVDDFMTRLRAIRDKLRNRPGGPYVVTVILDGENAWEWYANDGKDFLNGLYYNLSLDPTIKTVTPSEFLALYNQVPETIPDLWAGSWDSASFETWIGEDEENRAWDYLGATRQVLEEYLDETGQGSPDEAAVEQAYQAMLAAEGSDWFWWFGSDKDSGNDPAFDAQFRETLGQVHDALGLDRPAYLSVPIIQPVPVEPQVLLLGTFTPVPDGRLTNPAEWLQAGAFQFTGELTSLEFGFDKDSLYLRGDANPAGGMAEIYLKVPALSIGSPFSTDGSILGMYATHRILLPAAGTSQAAELQEWDPDQEGWLSVVESGLQYAAGGLGFELSVPLAELHPSLDTGDSLVLRVASPSGLLPESGPGRLQLPDLGRTTWILEVDDPADDDYGPGTYTYPGDAVFKPGVFDLLKFKVGVDENYLVLRVELRGPVENPWGSPNGLALQLIDVYFDVDGLYSGTQLLRSARNAAVSPENKWDYAVSIAGWNSGVFMASDPESATDIPLTIITDPGRNAIIAKIPLAAIPGDPAQWSYAVLVLSNDGYGPNGVREITSAGGQWQLGGAAADSNHPRVIDYLWPAYMEDSQESMLAGYPPSQADPTSLGAEAFARLKMITLQP